MRSAIRAIIVRIANLIARIILDSAEFKKLDHAVAAALQHLRDSELSRKRSLLIQELQDHVHLLISSLNPEKIRRSSSRLNELEDIRHYYALIVESELHDYAFLDKLPQFPDFHDDDGSTCYLKLKNMYVPGNEATIDARRAVVPWIGLLNDKNTGVFLVCGQSNAANHGEGSYVPKRNVYAFDFMTMKCYRADDPLPGASGNGGSIWPRLGDLLIEQRLFKAVLFISVAFGGTFITDWSETTVIQQRLILALSRLRRQLGRHFLPVTATLWQQGEAEANHTTMSAKTYAAHLHRVIELIRRNGVYCPTFVAHATYCEANDHPFCNHAAIRQAQREIVDIRQAVLQGPDIDTIADDGRIDRCHLSAVGLQRAAELWAEAIVRHAHLLDRGLDAVN